MTSRSGSLGMRRVRYGRRQLWRGKSFSAALTLPAARPKPASAAPAAPTIPRKPVPSPSAHGPDQSALAPPESLAAHPWRLRPDDSCARRAASVAGEVGGAVGDAVTW